MPRTVQAPSIARVVHYYEHNDRPAIKEQPRAAIITAVHHLFSPFCVSVHIFGGEVSAASSIPLYETFEQATTDKPNGGFAIWPPHVAPITIPDAQPAPAAVAAAPSN